MIKICAHRGDSSRFRENTIQAITAAISVGCDFVEIDLRLTKDGRVIVLHDPTLERLWGVSTPAHDLTWSEIQALGNQEMRIPLLEEVLPLFETGSTMLLVDMEDPAIAERSFEVVLASSTPQEMIAWCGHIDAMKIIRSCSREARVWMPWNDSMAPTVGDIEELDPEFVNLHYGFITEELVNEIHALGRKVSAWTVDDEFTFTWATKIGIDSVTTNQLIASQRLLCSEKFPGTELDLDRAMSLARALGSWANEVIRTVGPKSIETKANPADLVTNIDVMIERHVREVVTATFPTHNFIGEETAGEFRPGIPTWYLDPLDGTTNFANGIPWSSFSLALALDYSPLLGVVADPWRSEIFEAIAGQGAYLNRKPLKISFVERGESVLSGRVVSTELSAYEPWPGMLTMLETLAENFCTMRIMGSGTLSLVGVAASRGVGAVIGSFSPIDHLAATLIVHEAGGVVCDRKGDENLFPLGGGVMVCAPQVADALFEIWAAST